MTQSGAIAWPLLKVVRCAIKLKPSENGACMEKSQGSHLYVGWRASLKNGVFHVCEYRLVPQVGDRPDNIAIPENTYGIGL